MEHERDAVEMEGLRFFGTVSASISHEIKNVLSIMNETAGLLQDLVRMAGRGGPMDPDRLGRLADSMGMQIRRADGIVKNLNRFAHSADESVTRVDLGDLTGFVLGLCAREAFMRNVTLAFEPDSKPLPITTNPFVLETLLWRCLEAAMEAGGEGSVVEIRTEATEQRCRIRCSVLGDGRKVGMERVTGRVGFLLSALKAELTADPDSGDLVVVLPRDGAS